MSARISDSKNLFYDRCYKNDWTPTEAPTWNNTVQRVALTALPFLSLHAVFRLPISLGMGVLRVWTTSQAIDKTEKSSYNRLDQIMQTAIATASLASTLFSHCLGMVLTTAQEISIESKTLMKAIRSGDRQEILESLTRLVNHSLYLALITKGGLELSIVSLIFQSLVLLISSRKEFQKGHWLEGAGDLLLSAVRMKQGYTQFAQLRRQWEIEANIKRVFVGDLHGKWQFPSDHLPVGIEVNGTKIISWNVLNNAYMEWVTEKDSQGLNGSMISDLNIPVQADGLTKRDLLIVDQISSMTSSGHVIALQECGEPFLKALEQKLPSQWQMIRSFDKPREDQDVILFNRSHLNDRSHQTVTDAYASAPNRPIQLVVFSGVDQGGSSDRNGPNGPNLSIINGHIPGDPRLPARQEFAKFVYQTHSKNNVTVALGDNNFERDEMIEAYQAEGFTEFSLHSPWKTNVDPTGTAPKGRYSKAIDHALVVGEHVSRDLAIDEVLKDGGLREAVEVLSKGS